MTAGDAVCRMRDATCRMRDATCRMRDVVSDLQGHRNLALERNFMNGEVCVWVLRFYEILQIFKRDPVFSPNPMRPHPLLSCDCYPIELTATFDPTMRFKRSNSNLENFHDVFGVAAFSLLLTPWRDIS